MKGNKHMSRLALTVIKPRRSSSWVYSTLCVYAYHKFHRVCSEWNPVWHFSLHTVFFVIFRTMLRQKVSPTRVSWSERIFRNRAKSPRQMGKIVFSFWKLRSFCLTKIACFLRKIFLLPQYLSFDGFYCNLSQNILQFLAMSLLREKYLAWQPFLITLFWKLGNFCVTEITRFLRNSSLPLSIYRLNGFYCELPWNLVNSSDSQNSTTVLSHHKFGWGESKSDLSREVSNKISGKFTSLIISSSG